MAKSHRKRRKKPPTFTTKNSNIRKSSPSCPLKHPATWIESIGSNMWSGDAALARSKRSNRDLFRGVSRLLMTKMFQSFRSLREEEIINMLGSIRESCFSGSTVHINEILVKFSNNIISSTAIGKRYSELKNGNQFQELFLECTMICGYPNITDFIPWLGWLNRINCMESKVNRIAKEVDEYQESIVEQGVEKMMSSSSIDEAHICTNVSDWY
ncbi:OLC1v1036735C1 [Oldenlandia corymbosa var. corymbosa]|uniref:OLC1v1036735C1 n=1 Tax=Oldenlandia corymbosa var. corymbosa TaxID=529605 RepID=A0AAV1CZ86_OLDCO|nr:OLC1v1036735C1 [Oldenlandia corymbosa var. corymbosa]